MPGPGVKGCKAAACIYIFSQGLLELFEARALNLQLPKQGYGAFRSTVALINYLAAL